MGLQRGRKGVPAVWEEEGSFQVGLRREGNSRRRLRIRMEGSAGQGGQAGGRGQLRGAWLPGRRLMRNSCTAGMALGPASSRDRDSGVWQEVVVSQARVPARTAPPKGTAWWSIRTCVRLLQVSRLGARP